MKLVLLIIGIFSLLFIYCALVLAKRTDNNNKNM